MSSPIIGTLLYPSCWNDKDKETMIYIDHLELTNHRHQVVDRLDPLGRGEQVHDQIAQVAAVVASHLRKIMKKI